MDMDPHKLDDLFKGKLEHPGTPPFNEVHWKEARGMLQRRNINSRWLLGLFLLALVSSGLYFMVSNVKDAATVGTTERPLAASGPINGEITIWSDDSDHESQDENVELAVKENDLARKAKPSHDGVNMTLPEDSYEVAPDETAREQVARLSSGCQNREEITWNRYISDIFRCRGQWACRDGQIELPI